MMDEVLGGRRGRGGVPRSSAVCAVRPFELDSIRNMHDGAVCEGVWGGRRYSGAGRSRVKKLNEPIYGRY